MGEAGSVVHFGWSWLAVAAIAVALVLAVNDWRTHRRPSRERRDAQWARLHRISSDSRRGVAGQSLSTDELTGFCCERPAVPLRAAGVEQGTPASSAPFTRASVHPSDRPAPAARRSP